ncbi:MAG: sulfotransferase [Thainema sp.]
MAQITVDFLGIGVQRGASTWLWSNLRKHPGIWLPPVKELHYFDRSPKYHSPSYLSEKYFFSRAFNKDHHNIKFRRILQRHLTETMPEALSNKDWGTIKWFSKYLFGRVDDNWYQSLFKPGKDKIKGDITPAYSILDNDDIVHIKELFPNIKIILILRNPMDRAWSYICYEALQKRFQGINDLEKVKGLINGPTQSMRGDYLQILEKWEQIFPKEQIFIGFYEDVIYRPGNFIVDIFRFLGVNFEKYQHYDDLKAKVNASHKNEQEIPSEIQYLLARKYWFQIKLLHERFNNSYTLAWTRQAARIMKQHKENS